MMNTFFKGVSLAAVLVAGACGSAPVRRLTDEEMVTADPLPLAPGASWGYDVTVSRYDVDKDAQVTAEMEWSTTVAAVAGADGVAGGVKGFRVMGWPSDLAAFDTRRPVATERVILRTGNTFLWGRGSEASLDGAEGWFSWPLLDGQKVCPEPDLTYCWVVERMDDGYQLTYRTGIDEETYLIQPGTGVARYRYSLFGKSAWVEARLTAYTPGKSSGGARPK
jgi:hypothetical protein